MPRAISVLSPAERGNRPVIDTVILDYAQRSTQKIAVTGVKGGNFAIELSASARLRTDDLLVLDDGGLVEVVAAPEPFVAMRQALAAEPLLAYHRLDETSRSLAMPHRVGHRLGFHQVAVFGKFLDRPFAGLLDCKPLVRRVEVVQSSVRINSTECACKR